MTLVQTKDIEDMKDNEFTEEENIVWAMKTAKHLQKIKCGQKLEVRTVTTPKSKTI